MNASGVARCRLGAPASGYCSAKSLSRPLEVARREAPEAAAAARERPANESAPERPERAPPPTKFETRLFVEAQLQTQANAWRELHGAAWSADDRAKTSSILEALAELLFATSDRLGDVDWEAVGGLAASGRAAPCDATFDGGRREGARLRRLRAARARRPRRGARRGRPPPRRGGLAAGVSPRLRRRLDAPRRLLRRRRRAFRRRCGSGERRQLLGAAGRRAARKLRRPRLLGAASRPRLRPLPRRGRRAPVAEPLGAPHGGDAGQRLHARRREGGRGRDGARRRRGRRLLLFTVSNVVSFVALWALRRGPAAAPRPRPPARRRRRATARARGGRGRPR